MTTGVRDDFDKEISVASTLVPLLRTVTATGATVDLSGFNKAAFVINVGINTDGTHALGAEESDDNSSWGAVPAGKLSGAFVNAVANSVQEVGYLGTKRYVRVNVTVTGSPATGAAISAVVVRAGARTLPQ